VPVVVPVVDSDPHEQKAATAPGDGRSTVTWRPLSTSVWLFVEAVVMVALWASRQQDAPLAWSGSVDRKMTAEAKMSAATRFTDMMVRSLTEKLDCMLSPPDGYKFTEVL
jgi:hypothetical protein